MNHSRISSLLLVVVVSCLALVAVVSAVNPDAACPHGPTVGLHFVASAKKPACVALWDNSYAEMSPFDTPECAQCGYVAHVTDIQGVKNTLVACFDPSNGAWTSLCTDENASEQQSSSQANAVVTDAPAAHVHARGSCNAVSDAVNFQAGTVQTQVLNLVDANGNVEATVGACADGACAQAVLDTGSTDVTIDGPLFTGDVNVEGNLHVQGSGFTIGVDELVVEGDLTVKGDVSIGGDVNKMFHASGGSAINVQAGSAVAPGDVLVQMSDGTYCIAEADHASCGSKKKRETVNPVSVDPIDVSGFGDGLEKHHTQVTPVSSNMVVVSWMTNSDVSPVAGKGWIFQAFSDKPGNLDTHRLGWAMVFILSESDQWAPIGNVIRVGGIGQPIGDVGIRDMRVVPTGDSSFAIFYSVVAVAEDKKRWWWGGSSAFDPAVSMGFVSMYVVDGPQPECYPCNAVWYSADSLHATQQWEPTFFNPVLDQVHVVADQPPFAVDFVVAHQGSSHTIAPNFSFDNGDKRKRSPVPAVDHMMGVMERRAQAVSRIRARVEARSGKRFLGGGGGGGGEGHTLAPGASSSHITVARLQVRATGAVVVLNQAQTPNPMARYLFDSRFNGLGFFGELLQEESGGTKRAQTEQEKPEAKKRNLFSTNVPEAYSWREPGAPLGLVPVTTVAGNTVYALSVWNGLTSYTIPGNLDFLGELRSLANSYDLTAEGRGDLFSVWSSAVGTQFASEHMELCHWFDSDPSLYPSSLVRISDSQFVSRLSCVVGTSSVVFAYTWNVGAFGDFTLSAPPIMLYSYDLGPVVIVDGDGNPIGSPLRSEPIMHKRWWSSHEEPSYGPFANTDRVWQAKAPWDAHTDVVLSWDINQGTVTFGEYTPSIGSAEGTALAEATGYSQLPDLSLATATSAGVMGCNLVVLAEYGGTDGSSNAKLFITAPDGATCTHDDATTAEAEEAVCIVIDTAASGESTRCLLPGSLYTGFTHDGPLNTKLWYTLEGELTVDPREAGYSLTCYTATTCFFETYNAIAAPPVLENTITEVDSVMSVVVSLLRGLLYFEQAPAP